MCRWVAASVATIGIVVGLSAYVQTKLHDAEPAIRYVVAVKAKAANANRVQVAIHPSRLEVVAQRRRSVVDTVHEGLPHRPQPS